MKTFGTFRILLVAAVALVFETALLANAGWAGGRPDLLVPVVCFAALFAAEPAQALGIAWGAGLLRDLGTAGPLGQYALIYLALAWALVGLRTLLFREHPLTQAVVGGVGAALAGLASAACTSALAGGIPLGLALARAAGSALLTALLAPVLVTLLARARFLVR
jgi:rod shape-determining protein MreD